MTFTTFSGTTFQTSDVIWLDDGFYSEGDSHGVLLFSGRWENISYETAYDLFREMRDSGKYGVVSNFTRSGNLVVRTEDLSVVEVTKDDLTESEAFDILGCFHDDSHNGEYPDESRPGLESAIAIRFTRPLSGRFEFFPIEVLELCRLPNAEDERIAALLQGVFGQGLAA